MTTRAFNFARHAELARLVGIPYAEMDCYEIVVEALRVMGIAQLPVIPEALLAMRPNPLVPIADGEAYIVGDVIECESDEDQRPHLAVVVNELQALHARDGHTSALVRIDALTSAAKAAGKKVSRWRIGRTHS